jgi:hypothetical protein
MDLSIFLSSILDVDGYEVNGFGESIHESNLQVVTGKHTMKSMLISSHFQYGMLNDCNSPPGFI